MRTRIINLLLMLFTLVFSVNAQLSKKEAVEKGYARLGNLNMYYEVLGRGRPIVLLHGAYMTMEGMMREYANELSKTRMVILTEFQAHGRTADVSNRDLTYEGLADDVASLLNYLKVDSADVFGYSMGGGVALQMAIRHPKMVKKIVCLSASYSDEGMQPAFKPLVPTMTVDLFNGTSFRKEYDSLAPDKKNFPGLFRKLKKLDMTDFNWESDYKKIKSPVLLIAGDVDMVTIDHVAGMLKKLDGNKPADLGQISKVHLAVMPNTSHVGMMQRFSWISPMVKEFLN